MLYHFNKNKMRKNKLKLMKYVHKDLKLKKTKSLKIFVVKEKIIKRNINQISNKYNLKFL